MPPGTPGSDAHRRAFRLHVSTYIVATVALLGLNMASDPDTPWAFAVLLPWGIAVALHAARLMGLWPRGR